MPAPRSSSSSRSGGSAGRKSTARSTATTKRKAPSAGRRSTSASAKRAKSTGSGSSVSSGSLGELIANSIIRPLDLVLISRERIQQTLDEAAERGRVTRTDANELVAELIRRGRQQTDDLLRDFERLAGRGRGQLESAGKRVRTTEPVDRIVRSADRARRTIGVGSSFPILGYDDLTAGQVEQRLSGLSAPELRKVRDYERRHANRKSVLETIERLLA